MADLSGRTFGQYQLIEPISSGGMATIYKAYQPALDRVVAIKVLPEYLLDQPGFLERFKIEAQAIARLDHPHILPIYDYGEAERTPYLVMKYVPGGTLKDLMARGPIDPRQAALLLRQMAEALEHAHHKGIIHRDVKPSNVLLQNGRWVQLMNFGLAKLMTGTSDITASGTGVGTPDYMSPSDGSVYAYVGHTRYDSAEEAYTLLPGTACRPRTNWPLAGTERSSRSTSMANPARACRPGRAGNGRACSSMSIPRPTSPAASTM